MQLLIHNHSSIYADIGSNRIFASHILHADLKADLFIISFCANKSLNNEVLQLPSLNFTCNYQNAYISFAAYDAIETQFNAQPAIQFPLPQALILDHRREYPRVKIPHDFTLRCIADEGGYIPFEARISDISHDGLGGIVYGADIRLEPGAILKACRIIIPGGKSVIADLELRYITTITQSGGRSSNRAGFRFIQRSDEIQELVKCFIQDLDN